MKSDEAWTWEEWKRRVDHHDLSYNYSDDGGVWRAGEREYKLIQNNATRFPRKDVVEYWNQVCDRKFIEPYNKQFYWKE